MSEVAVTDQKTQILSGVVKTLLDDLRSGAGDRDRRRQVEEWMRTLAEKYPEFQIESGLRDYYLAEAERLRVDFEKATELNEKLALGRSIQESFDRSAQRQLLVELSRFFEINAQTFGFGQVVVAQAGLDLELRVLLGQRAHPLLDLAAAIFVAGSVFQIVEQRFDDARKDLRALIVQGFLCHGRGC